MTKNHQKLCSELFPFYETWKSAVLDAKKAMKDFASAENEEEIRQARENFQNAKQKAEQAKQEYEDKAYERVGFEGEEITYKDALLLSSLKEKIGDFEWEEENGRVQSIKAIEKDLSSVGEVYFPDSLQKLWLNHATIQNHEKINFPDSLQKLDLYHATIQNPENLKFPDNLQVLWLDNATIKNPENLKFPDNLRLLFLEGTTMNEAFQKKIREYKKRNPNVGICGVEL
jgi:hypothetical protein